MRRLWSFALTRVQPALRNRRCADRRALTARLLGGVRLALGEPSRFASFRTEHVDRGEIPTRLSEQALYVFSSERFGGHGSTLRDAPNPPLTAIPFHPHTTVLQKSHGVPDSRAFGGRRGRSSDRPRPSAVARLARISPAARERGSSHRPSRRPALGGDRAEDGNGVAAELRVAIAEVDRRRTASPRVRRLRPPRRS